MVKPDHKIGSRIAERGKVLIRDINAVDTSRGAAAIHDAHLVAINALLGMVGEMADEIDRLTDEITALKPH